ncbi:hypothetical protein BU14_1524s0003 [Porphyra umbilicalis]|uniref:Uncharacterized protein n=1 Tax=Porphyra umbilicalis TaxID=2786 RepID=A0A1X6NLA7_PORUM|nr:hypothetical protein BU14_1524s0003 [Porphyra umbilicalis]|eukprot:OSX69429.1 hypothetical protein BU14_1524s0003 [Porphyra umbilicalis]
MTLSAALSCWLPLRDRLRFARPSCHLLLLCWLGRSCRRRSRLAARAGAMRLQFLLLAAIVMGAAAAVLAAPAPGVAAGLTGPRPPHQHREVTAGLVGKRAMRRLQSMSRQKSVWTATRLVALAGPTPALALLSALRTLVGHGLLVQGALGVPSSAGGGTAADGGPLPRIRQLRQRQQQLRERRRRRRLRAP